MPLQFQCRLRSILLVGAVLLASCEKTQQPTSEARLLPFAAPLHAFSMEHNGPTNVYRVDCDMHSTGVLIARLYFTISGRSEEPCEARLLASPGMRSSMYWALPQFSGYRKEAYVLVALADLEGAHDQQQSTIPIEAEWQYVNCRAPFKEIDMKSGQEVVACTFMWRTTSDAKENSTERWRTLVANWDRESLIRNAQKDPASMVAVVTLEFRK